MPNIASRLGLAGRLRIDVHDRSTGLLVARRAADNLIVTSGITLLGQALNYALVLAENPTWGSPYAAPVGVMYGAVGTSTTAAAAANTALGAEIGRASVSNAGVGAATLSYDFFLPTTVGNGTINEVGVFGAADLVTPTLTAVVNSGSTYTSLSVSGVTEAIPAAAVLTLGYGTGTTQQVTTSSPTAVGASTIAVSSFTAAATFTSGQLAAYTPGTLIDRAVLASPVVKTTAQTATINLTLTLTSA